MHLSSLVEMVESAFASRPLLGKSGSTVSGGSVSEMARAGALGLRGYDALVYVGENDRLLPVALLAASCAGIPFVPLNYRLGNEALNELVDQWPNALVLTDADTAVRIAAHANVQLLGEWLSHPPAVDGPPVDLALDDNAVAVVLYTSGTTSAPKAVRIRHRHLMAYLLNTVAFGGAEEHEAVLVAVPPYHIAGVANMLSNLFAGRRIVYLSKFEARAWLQTVRGEGITNAMVVPTMLARIVEVLSEGSDTPLPSLRHLSYGGAKISERVLREALRMLPDTDFVNAYGLTETASTVAVLDPDDHRRALMSDDPRSRRRLTSVGRPLPNVEIEVRAENGSPVGPSVVGMIYVRGDQIAGEYATGSVLDAHGWFCTRDQGYIDEEGYLFIEGRADDTIIRGGENIAPAEIEEVLLAQPGIRDACVVGVPDDEWGQRIVAVVVADPGLAPDEQQLRSIVKLRLRGSKTPDTVVFRSELPHSDTGKLLRRVVSEELQQIGDPR